MLAQDFNETRHVGAFEIVRQFDVHVEDCDRVLFVAAAVLDPDRMAQSLYPDLVDRQVAVIGFDLNISNREKGHQRRFGMIHGSKLRFDS